MKKITSLLLLFILLFSFCSFGAKIDGDEIKSTLLNGTTMVPLEQLAELLDLEFFPSSENYTVSEKNDEPKMLSFVHETPDKVYAADYVREEDGSLTLFDEEEIVLPQAFLRIDGALYVPFRFVCEYFGANVYWNEKDGAYAYRTSYGETALIRTNGEVRERIEVKGGFESGLITGEYFVFIRGGSLYKMSLEDKKEILLGKAGKVHVAEDKIFVLGSGSLKLIDLETGEKKTVTDGVSIVGYTAENGAWCDTQSGSFVYDKNGELLASITGEFYTSWEFFKGYVYYLTEEMEMRRARPDGTEDEALIKTALYPQWVDGYIYYTDAATNYRRFDIETGEDIMVYGLNLEYRLTLDGKHIMNFYPENEKGSMYISNPDGTAFRPFGTEGVIIAGKSALFKDGIAALGAYDNSVYYITEEKALKLTDDSVSEFCGVYGDFIYYSIK